MSGINDFDVVCDQTDNPRSIKGNELIVSTSISSLLMKPNLARLFPPMASKEVNEDDAAPSANKE